MNKELSLPSFAKEVSSPHSDSGKVSIVIEVDPSKAFPEWLAMLASEDYPINDDDLERCENPENPDQYWVEVAYQCTKLDVQAALAGTNFDPRLAGKPAEFHFKNCPEWALTRFKKGKGVELATQGKQARRHYKRVRGSLPF